MTSTSTENPFGVVRATQADEDAIFEVLCALHEENGMWPMNPVRVREEICKATRGSARPAIIGLIKGETGAIEGLVWLLLTDSWYSDWVSWCERLLFVVPEHRRSTHAKRLVQFAKWCSDAMSEQLRKDGGGEQKEIPLIIGIQTFKALEPKMRLYQRQFSQIGATFMHRMVPKSAFNQRRIEPHKLSSESGRA